MDYKKVIWSDEFEAEFGPQMKEHLEAIKSECLEDHAKIWKSDNGVFIIGPDNKELVVMFMSGSKMETEILDIINYASTRFNSLRMTSYRKGMEKFLTKYGLKRREITMGISFNGE